MIPRIIPRACTCKQAKNRLLGAVWCVFVLLLVLCAIEATQHSNQYSGVLPAAWVLPVRAAMAMCARGGRIRFAWRPEQRVCAGRVVDTPWCFGGKIPLRRRVAKETAPASGTTPAATAGIACVLVHLHRFQQFSSQLSYLSSLCSDIDWLLR